MERSPINIDTKKFESKEVDLSKFKSEGVFLFNNFGIEAYISATESEKEALLTSFEFQTTLQQRMVYLLSRGGIDYFKKLTDLNLHTSETLQPALQQRMVYLLSIGDIKEFKELSDLNFHTPEILQLALQKGMVNIFSNGNINSFKKLSDLNLHTPEILQLALQKGMVKLLSVGNINSFKELTDLNLHTFNIQDIPELQPALQQRIVNLLSRGDFSEFKELTTLNLHTPETLQTALQKGMIDLLSRGSLDTFKALIDLNLHTFNIQDIPELQPALQRRMVGLFSVGRINEFKELSDFNFHTFNIQDVPELQSILQQRMVDLLSRGDFNEFKELTTLNLHTPEILQPALQQRMVYLLSIGNINAFKKLTDLNLHTSETLQPALQQRMAGLLSEGRIDDFKKLSDLNLHTFNIQDIPELQPALQQRMVNLLSWGDIDTFKELTDLNLHTFNIQDVPELQPTLQQRMVKLLSEGRIDDFKKLTDLNLHTFNIQDMPELQPALQQGMVTLLSKIYINSFKALTDFNFHTFNIQDIPELQPTLQQVMVKLLSEGNINSFKELIDLNLHTPEILQLILQQRMAGLLSEGRIDDFKGCISFYQGDVRLLVAQAIEKLNLTSHLNFLESFAPGFTEKLYTQMSVFEGFIALREVTFEVLKKNLEQNPFLARALNHPYGARLLTKYPQLDTISHDAIRTLFTIQEQATEPWDTNEYRLQAQATLSELSYNKNTLEAIQAKGIHLESWLHRDEEVYFSLGREDETSLGERIATPIKRLNETVDMWKKVVGGVLAEYKEELKNALITEDIIPLQEEKKKMEQRLQEVLGDEKKTQGIKKGISNLEARIAQPKQIQIWNKLTSDVVGIERLGKELVAQNTALVEQEEKLKTLTPKEAIGVKKELKTLEQTLRESVNKLQVRFDVYYANLVEVLTPVLTKERAESLVQEMKEKLLEDHDHYLSDIRALRELFTQDKDNNSKLEGRPMRIRLASRHTNDLYIGNYTDCCVAIDNDVHGDESPIADYLTDLAMQIVLIEDMSVEPAMPVAAAWTFLGEDIKGDTSMVIDNIEGRGVYCASFKDDLEKRLSAYMEEYAKACGTKLSQGTQNNDLVVSSVNGQGKYKKLGIATRFDGYYLEAEGSEDEEDEEDEEAEGGEDDFQQMSVDEEL